MTGEHWRPVADFESIYEVSDLGRVRSLDRLVGDSPGSSQRVRRFSGRTLGQLVHGDGYRVVHLSRGGKRRAVLVHRLVAAAFLGSIPDGHEVCHEDGNRANNRADNLRIDTHVGNEADKVKHETLRRGEQVHLSKLTESDVREIRTLAAAGETQEVIARRFGVTRSNVSYIASGKTWAHVWQGQQ